MEDCILEGIKVVEGVRFQDLRGELIKPYSAAFFNDACNLEFKETWFTKSHKGVIRGMHLQVEPYACEKYVSCIQGKIVDVLLDIRNNSPTFGKYFSIELSEDEIKGVYIPKGIAHGYKVIEDSIVMYMATDINRKEYDIGIRWNSFGYDWKIDAPIISEKDMLLPEFNG